MGAPLDQFLMNTGEMCRTFCEKIRSVVCVATKTDLLQEADPGCFGPDPEVLKDIGDSHCGTVSLPVLRQVEPELFSCMNQKTIFHSWSQNFYYDIQTRERGKASDCIRCGKCERVCPQHLPIRKLLQDVAAAFEQR